MGSRWSLPPIGTVRAGSSGGCGWHGGGRAPRHHRRCNAPAGLQRFPDLGERQQISTEGGLDPTWSPNGQALFFLGLRGDGVPDEMAVVNIDLGPPLSVGNPEVLFDHAPYRRRGAEGRMYDIAPDGQRFLMLSRRDSGSARSPRQVNVVLNWFQELTERVPTN